MKWGPVMSEGIEALYKNFGILADTEPADVAKVRGATSFCF